MLLLCLFVTGADGSPARAREQPLSAVGEAFEEGRFEDVLAAFEGTSLNAEARYLRARALAELSRPGEALDALGETPASWPDAVKEDVRNLRVAWSAEAGRCGQLEALAKERPTDRKAQNLLSRCLFKAGEHGRAAELLRDKEDTASRAMLVRALVELGKHDEARPLARALYLEHPAHGQARDWHALLSQAGPLTLKIEEHFQRAENLIKARKPEEAHKELEGLDKRTPAKLRARLWHLRGEALFKARNRYDEAERAYTRALRFKGDDEAHDAFHAIRAASRAGKDASAITRYRAFAQRYAKSPLAPQALYLSSWLRARGKGASARTSLKAFVESSVAAKSPGLKRSATWDLAWLAIERGDAHDALRWLAACEPLADSPMQAARVAYWQGRAALILRQTKRAREHFQAALTRDRLGWYAQLAARRLMAMGDPPPAAFDTSAPVLPALPELEPPPEVAFYRELGLSSDAAAAAQSWLKSLPDRPTRVGALLLVGDAPAAFKTAAPIMQDVLATPPTGPSGWLWRSLFPRPYATSVEANTTPRGLPSALFYGHMQVESRYQPHVVSWADAIGLMQLLPSTASKVAEGLGIPAHRGALVRPHINITLGAQYLSGLVSRYNGQLPPAIAAYNAGTQRIDGWLSHKPVELDRWVERIPIDQTRNYVRRVISAYSRYHAMESPENPWDIPLPETLSLKGK